MFDGAECVSASDAFGGEIGFFYANALAKLTEFIGIGGVPYGFIFRVASVLAVFEHMTCSGIHDGEGYVLGHVVGGSVGGCICK